MKATEFIQQVQLGLPKFLEEMDAQEAEHGPFDQMSEADWWEAYSYWVENNGVNPNDSPKHR